MNRTRFHSLQWQQVNLVIGNKQRLHDINFIIEHKGITAIMGGNGAGKTSLLKLCMGLLTATSGTVLWHYENHGHYKNHGRYENHEKHNALNPQQPSSQLPSLTLTPSKLTSPELTPPELTMVPQKTVLFNTSVKQNIFAPLHYHRTDNADKRTKMALQWAEIEHLQNHAALHLSTGEQQLVALARAWALQPAVLLLDEPCANLDPVRKRKMDALILQLSHDCKIILSTHSIQQARQLANDIILLEHGKLLAHLEHTHFFDSAEFNPFLGVHSYENNTSV